MQHLILFITLLLTLGLAFTVIRWRGGVHMTFSQHAATNRSSKIFYSLLFLVALPILMLFFSSWLVPNKNLPDIFLWFAWVAVVFQIVCTWVPEDGGMRTVIHRILTGISGIAILPPVAIIATTSNLSVFMHTTSLIALFLMIALLGVALKHQKGYKWALLLQVSYYAIFFLVILAATYF
jgi:hypothetical protein